MFVSFLSDINSPALPQQRQRGGYRWVWRNYGRRLTAVPWHKHCQPRGCWAGNGVDWFGWGGQRGICLKRCVSGRLPFVRSGWLAGRIGQSTNGTRQFKLVNFTRDNSSSAESTLSIRRLVNPSGPVVTDGNLPLIFVSGKLRKCLSASYWPLSFPDFNTLPQSHKGGVTLVVLFIGGRRRWWWRCGADSDCYDVYDYCRCSQCHHHYIDIALMTSSSRSSSSPMSWHHFYDRHRHHDVIFMTSSSWSSSSSWHHLHDIFMTSSTWSSSWSSSPCYHCHQCQDLTTNFSARFIC